MPDITKIYIPSLQALESFAQQLAPALQPGDVLALNGPMGAGKTTFTQALGRALDIQEKIVSPTYVLIHEYLSGQLPLVHVDFYRLGPEGAETLATEILSILDEQAAVVVVEWAQYAQFMEPYVSLSLNMIVHPEETRTLEVAWEKASHRSELVNVLHSFPKA